MKIIYVFEQRHGYVYDMEMFEMKIFLDAGYEVEVWSTVNWTYGNVKLERPENVDRTGRTRYIDGKKNLLYELNRVKNEKCFFIIYSYNSYTFVSYLLRKNIKMHGFDFCNVSEFTCIEKSPDVAVIIDLPIRTIKRLELRATIKEVVIYFLRPFVRILRGDIKSIPYVVKVKAQDLYARKHGPFKYKSKYNFVTTALAYNSFPDLRETKSKRNILIHSLTYDEYQRAKTNDEKLINEDYVLYIDMFETGHSDFKKMNVPFPIKNKKAFFDQLDYLFTKIENQLGMPVIIAAHPKAEYHNNEFRKRRVIQFKTNVLINHANMVIAGTSTCIGNIVLAKTRFLPFFSSEYFENLPSWKSGYDNLSKCFEAPLLDIRNQVAVDGWQSYVVLPDSIGFMKYKERYLLSNEGIIDKQFFEVVKEYIEKERW